MKLRALRLWNVRKFADRGIAIEGIGDGVNVLSAENEFGKSTSFDALHALFFQPHSGTPKAVQMLRPYSGGSPQIEVDVETDEGLFRIHKQYYKGKQAIVTELSTGRIIAQADAAETWISKLVHGGSSGPAGLLWVQQGNTEIGGGNQREKDEDRKAREDVLTSITGDEVELLTGGRRMVRVFNKTLSGLEKLVTSSGKAKAGGPYAMAIDAHQTLQEEEEKLSLRIEELRSALDARRSILKRLSALNDPATIERRQQAMKQATEALEKAKAHADKLKLAETAEKLAQEKLLTAQSAVDDHTKKMGLAVQLIEKLASDEKHHTESNDNLSKTTKSDQQAGKALKEAEQNLDNARKLLDAARQAKAALQAASQVAEIKQRLENAKSIRSDIETLSAEQKALSFADSDMLYLEKLEQKIAVLTATVKAESIMVQIEYLDDARQIIRQDGEPISGSEAISISAAETFGIPDIGHLTISPGVHDSADTSQAALKATENNLKQYLTDLGFKNVAAAREQQTVARTRASTLLVKQSEFEILAPEGLKALRQYFAEVDAKSAPASADVMDPDDAEAKLDTSRTSQQAADSTREIARTTLQEAKETHLRSDIKLTGTREEYERAETELGSKDERNDRLKSLQKALESETGKFDSTTAAARSLRTDAPDLETIAASCARFSSVVESAQKETHTLGHEVAELNGRIATFANHGIEEVYEETKDKRIAAEVRVSVMEREVAALEQLKQALEDARASAKEQYFGPVMAELKPLLTLLLDEASITFDDATLLPKTLGRNGLDEDIAFLSGGMREQLAILTRLAFARLLAKGGNTVPVILDDALVYSDDDRIERMFNALHRQANDIQILVLTCRQRAFEQLGGNGLRMVDWTPTGQ